MNFAVTDLTFNLTSAVNDATLQAITPTGNQGDNQLLVVGAPTGFCHRDSNLEGSRVASTP